MGTFLEGVRGTIEITGQTLDRKQLLRENPKRAVNEFLFNLMLDVYLLDSKAKLWDARAKVTEQLFAATKRL